MQPEEPLIKLPLPFPKSVNDLPRPQIPFFPQPAPVVFNVNYNEGFPKPKPSRLFVEDAEAMWSTGKQPTEITLPVAT